MRLMTHELDFFGKLIQVNWMNPRNRPLEEFALEADMVNVSRKNGDVFAASIL